PTERFSVGPRAAAGLGSAWGLVTGGCDERVGQYPRPRPNVTFWLRRGAERGAGHICVATDPPHPSHGSTKVGAVLPHVCPGCLRVRPASRIVGHAGRVDRKSTRLNS